VFPLSFSLVFFFLSTSSWTLSSSRILSEISFSRSDKIRELDNVQDELDRIHQSMEKESGNTVIILIGLGAIVFLLLAALLFVMLKNNNRQVPVPPWMMPPPPRRPRRPKKKEAKKEEKNSEPAQKTEEPASDPQPEPVAAPAAPQPEQAATAENLSPPSSDDDPSVVRSEINDIRKSVVSMSVGQPDRTTTIVKEWLEQPEPAPPAEPEPEVSGGDSEDEEAEEKEK
jgi:hypothetical protein